jgi:hypothetical protein
MPPRKRTQWLQIGSGKSYAHRVHQPLQSLIFIAPLLIFYQIASTLHPTAATQTSGPDVVAFLLMLKFFALFGAAGKILPPLAVVAILLSWHLARHDKWTFDPKLYLGMFGESILWAIPIFVIGLAMLRYSSGSPPHTPGYAISNPAHLSWFTDVFLSIGAGVYEELLFRLIAITTLNILLVDICELRLQTAIPIIIITSAVLFSAYHYLGSEPIPLGSFFFLTAMGVYLAGIYIYRGFGITVGTHALYDLIVVSLLHFHI